MCSNGLRPDASVWTIAGSNEERPATRARRATNNRRILHVKSKIDPPVWFLEDKTDVRSSYALEDVATEFDIQGLELDWVGVCWDANFRRQGSKWDYYNFRGARWERISDPVRIAYRANAYRVLLTRARQE
jgi:hypothetical protein